MLKQFVTAATVWAWANLVKLEGLPREASQRQWW